jgi:hypothetical protein
MIAAVKGALSGSGRTFQGMISNLDLRQKNPPIWLTRSASDKTHCDELETDLGRQSSCH